MDQQAEGAADLVVCNVPAKAGEAVHEAFLAGLSHRVAHGGLAALVIVSPLEESFRRMIGETGHLIVYEERTANHLVLHLEPAPAASGPEKEPSGPLGASFRRHGTFTLNRQSYLMDTVYGLPDFDTPSFAVQTAAGLLAKESPGGGYSASTRDRGICRPCSRRKELSARQGSSRGTCFSSRSPPATSSSTAPLCPGSSSRFPESGRPFSPLSGGTGFSSSWTPYPGAPPTLASNVWRKGSLAAARSLSTDAARTCTFF